MNEQIRTVVIVHAAAEWLTFHRRALLLALGDVLPRTVGLLCVNRPISFDVAPLKHPGKFWTGVWRVGLAFDESRIVVATPRLPLHERVAAKLPGAQTINRHLMRSQLHDVLASRFPSAERIIQWIYYPVQRWLWDIFPEGGKVYECYDEYARSPGGDLNAARWQADIDALRGADLTFATARSLMQARAPVARRMQYLPNGVPDFFFDDGQDFSPDPIDALPRPRIGYLGNLRSIVDFQLLEQVFRANPGWQLVVVGPTAKGVRINNLRSLSNVHFLGPRPYHRVPGILRRLDIGLVPFVINEFTHAINPLKLYEYLSMRLPVVATRLPEIERLRDVVRLRSNDPADFAGGIEQALSAGRSSDQCAAVAAARQFSWTNIAREFALPALRSTFAF